MSSSCTLEIRNTFVTVTAVVVTLDVERSNKKDSVRRTVYLNKEMKGSGEIFDCKSISAMTAEKTDRRQATRKPI